MTQSSRSEIAAHPEPGSHLIVGGGLAGGLIALALANAGRGAGVVLLDADARLGGNHTWSFHATDLGDDERALVAPLVTAQWSKQLVRFPGRDRTIEGGYASISSARFATVIAARLRAVGAQVRLGTRVSSVGSTMARLDDETVLRGEVVIDARGPAPQPTGPATLGHDRTGFQKFLGLELELETDGPWRYPVLMDATVPQIDGYRFTYVLPFSARRVLVEDTVYSGTPEMDWAEVERRVLSYAAEHGAMVKRIVRRETGVLPLPLRAARHRTKSAAFPITVGYRGGFFHAVTGYSLPLAARVAIAVAKAQTAEQTAAAVGAIGRAIESQHRFGRLLNRLMFDAMPAPARWTALDRFYRLPEPTIARFYASRTTWWDRARVLLGRPPEGISWRLLVGARMEET